MFSNPCLVDLISKVIHLVFSIYYLKPSDLHTTIASLSVKSSLQTRPHFPSCLTATVPIYGIAPLTSLNIFSKINKNTKQNLESILLITYLSARTTLWTFELQLLGSILNALPAILKYHIHFFTVVYRWASFPNIAIISIWIFVGARYFLYIY